MDSNKGYNLKDLDKYFMIGFGVGVVVTVISFLIVMSL